MSAPLTTETSEALVESHDFAPLSTLIREIVPLEQSDVDMLEAAGPEHSMTQVKHIRAYHHVIAMRLAAGERARDICATMGFTPATITRLQDSPQFAELVESYRERLVDKAVDIFGQMELVAAESITAIHERLIGDERDDIPLEMLRRIGETFSDRIGHSPVRRSESSNVHKVALDDTTIERIKAQHSEHRRWNDPTGSIPLAALHQADSESVGAAAGASSIFVSAQAAEPGDKPSGSGQGV